MSNWRNRIVGHGEKPAIEFLANPANWRVHPKAQQDSLSGVLGEVGWVQNVIINKTTGHVVDGHMRVEIALSQGENTAVPYVEVDLTEEEEKLILATIDPISAMAVTDAQQLDALLRDVSTADAAVMGMLSALANEAGLSYGDADEPPGDPGAAISRAEEWQAKWGVERGQVWVIGRHRLMCGDSYSADDIARLLDGRKPDMLHTDPPYGIDIVKPKSGSSAADSGGAKPFGATGETGRKGKAAIAERNSGKVGGEKGDLISKNNVGRGDPPNIVQSNLYPVIEGDDRPFDPSSFIAFAPIVVLWGANYYADKLPISSCWICWDKRENITRNNFADGEIAWTNQDKPMRIFHHLWNGLHKGSQHGEKRLHPTEKPVALFEEIGRMFCDKGLWVDLFAGSGAQLVAAERTGATCYAMEYEPLYVATIIERLSQMGLAPKRAEA
jgi:hypothetical protein